ncbi:MAG: hypothetical protein LBG64_01430 [Pseudomonadales bacterium]|jgi:hypothetical protein|nr:hypothetical protein [Pseudomonadales bacterium]
MKNRSPIVVALVLPLVTCFLYPIYWFIVTGNEMSQRGVDLPAIWWVFIPGLNLVWLFKWAQGVEQISNGKVSAITLFIIGFVFLPAEMFIAQKAFNEAGRGSHGGGGHSTHHAQPHNTVPQSHVAPQQQAHPFQAAPQQPQPHTHVPPQHHGVPQQSHPVQPQAAPQQHPHPPITPNT